MKELECSELDVSLSRYNLCSTKEQLAGKYEFLRMKANVQGK